MHLAAIPAGSHLSSFTSGTGCLGTTPLREVLGSRPSKDVKVIILFKACLFNLTFYKGSHSKGLKQRALHVHQRKTKHFIAKLFAQPFMVLQTFLKSMGTIVQTCQRTVFLEPYPYPGHFIDVPLHVLSMLANDTIV